MKKTPDPRESSTPVNALPASPARTSSTSAPHAPTAVRAGAAIDSADGLRTGAAFMSAERCLQVHRLIVRTRAMEERMIKMSKSGEGFFWIGGPGEEAFSVPLGLLGKRGEGPEFDYWHLKYRSSGTVLALGGNMKIGFRQMAMTRTDTSSMGRNFTSHFCIKEWNVVPVTSVIATQFVVAPGTAHVQKRHGGDGITVVVGGDAGTAEGDFQSCLLWSSLPQQNLPVLIVVMNNGWGISTPQCSVHAGPPLGERGKAFGFAGEVVDGNDPVASWDAVARGMNVCRKDRKPYLIEARVSRLYGHSSSSGAPRDASAPDCLAIVEKRLVAAKICDEAYVKQVHAEADAEVSTELAEVLAEPKPTADDIHFGVYAPSEHDAVYPEDFTGLP